MLKLSINHNVYERIMLNSILIAWFNFLNIIIWKKRYYYIMKVQKTEIKIYVSYLNILLYLFYQNK